MSDLRSRVAALLRAELAAEVAAGFPRLKLIPYTDIIWFLDYFAGLAADEKTALLDALARSAARSFFPLEARGEYDELMKLPAFARFQTKGLGYKGGTRYTGIKMLSMDPSLRNIGNYHEGWVQNCSPLAFQPRPDLLPDLRYLTTAKAPALRKLVQAALGELLPEKENTGGGNWKYFGSFGASKVTLWIDYGSMLGQLVYGVSVANPDYRIKVYRLAYEHFWGVHLGWDYLTEENAPRSITFLTEQVLYLVHLAERLNGLAVPG